MVASLFTSTQFFRGGSSEPVADFYISTTGNDGNDGSSASPWLTFDPLIAFMNTVAPAQAVTAYVRSGTYEDTNLIFDSSITAAGCSLTITIADGTIFSGPTGVDRSWVNIGGSVNWTLEVLGESGGLVPTWTIEGYDTGTGNGLGMDSAGGATLIARNVLSQGNVDGVSLHNSNSNCEVYNSVFKSCSKSAGSHVSSGGSFYAENCEFWGNPGGSTLGIYFETTNNSSNTELVNCKFIPTGSVGTERNCDFRGATLRGCQIGTETLPINLVGSAQTTIIEDSYMNAFWDMNRPVSLLRCFGLASLRMRNSATPSVVSHCAFTGPATGQVSGFPYRNFDPGSSAQVTFINTVLRGYTTAHGQAYTAPDAAYWLAANCESTNCCLFGNTTNVDADIVSADPGSITNTVTADPLMGSFAGSMVQANYAVSASGPCAGTGTAGSNIGFTTADI